MLAGLLDGALLASGVASAATHPSERACLLAWNAPTNAANLSRVVAGLSWSGSSLRNGIVGTIAWEHGAPSTQTTAEGCLLKLAKPGLQQPVTGIWRGGGVIRWSFGRTINTDKAISGSNVRVLPDGRVTNIYLR